MKHSVFHGNPNRTPKANPGGIWIAITIIGYLIRMILKLTETEDHYPWERRD